MKPTIWTTRKDEEALRSGGYDIPPYPEEGQVKKDGDIIGHVDNFAGIIITDVSQIDNMKQLAPKAGFWNC